MEITFAVLIILFGFALIEADVLFIPGGIIGTFGALLILASIVISYKILGRETAFVLGGSSLVLAFILAFVSIKLQIWKKFVSNTSESKTEGFLSTKDDPVKLIGLSGEAVTDLRPSGTVILDNIKKDAIAESGFIEKGKEIEVVGANAAQVIVKLIDN